METRRLEAKNFSTGYVDVGNGDAIVLLHAIGLDHLLWSGVAASLATHFRVIAYDLRGHGSASPLDDADGMARHADDLAAVLDRLGIAKAHLVGLSFGGAVAQQFALARPERLSALTLVATIGEGKPVFEERAAAAERDGIRAQIKTTLERWFNARTLEANAPAVRYARRCLENLAVSSWCQNWRSLAGFKGLSKSTPLSVPVHVIAGANDRSTPPEMMKSLADALSGSRFSVVRDAPHLIALEYPKSLAAIIGSTPGEEPGQGHWLAAIRTEKEPGTLFDANAAATTYPDVFRNATIGKAWIFERTATRKDAEDRQSAFVTACAATGVPIEVSLVGRCIGAYGDLDSRAPYLLPIPMPAPHESLAELDRWYCEEHVGMLLASPVWQSIERYAVETVTGADWTRLMLHGIRSEAPLQDPVARLATTTPWRDRLAEQPWFGAGGRNVFANNRPETVPHVQAR